MLRNLTGMNYKKSKQVNESPASIVKSTINLEVKDYLQNLL